MGETDKQPGGVYRALRGEIDTDPAAYRRERFARMLAGEPTWIARGDSPTSDVYNYYRHGERLAYVAVDDDGKVSAAETIDNADYPLPLPPDTSLEAAAFIIDYLHELDEQEKAG